jgi:MFS family permease
VRALGALGPDARLLFATRAVRMFAFGSLAVVLVLYLRARGLSDAAVGVLLSLTLVGDAAVSIAVTAVADRVGRRRMLALGAALVVAAGVAFALSANVVVLTVAAILGTISVNGGEVGPSVALEQAAIGHAVPAAHRTAVFAWYQVTGSASTALGALAGGALAAAVGRWTGRPLEGYRAVLFVYAALGLVLLALGSRLSAAVEPASDGPRRRGALGLHRSRAAVTRLAGLFALDSFGSGLAVQTLVAAYLERRFGAGVASVGAALFAANLLGGASALLAPRLAARVGLVNTMVWTHLPANLLLAAFPFMPSFGLAMAALLARFSVAQMDVPARVSYTMAVVDPDERAAAAGLTNNARLVGNALGPVAAGALAAAGWLGAPFLLAGVLKAAYDLLLYRGFAALRPPEERRDP